jgi:WD40-like Beta Propeller Repeat
MYSKYRWSHLTALLLSLTVLSHPAHAQWQGHEAVPSEITIVDINNISQQVIHKSPHRLEAPNWSPDGSYLLLNGRGKLWRLALKPRSQPQPIETGSAGWIDINHGISPDGRWLTFTSGPIFRIPARGGEPTQLTVSSPSYFQSWSPDGHRLLYTTVQNGNVDVASLDLDTKSETRLTSNPALDDTADYSPDTRWIYFNSTRAKTSDVWRIPANASIPADSSAERITSDSLEDWSPHPSPDGKSLIFLSYKKGTQGHPYDRDVVIRRTPQPDNRLGSAQAKIDQVARFVGGHGSFGARPWSPDGRKFVYVSFKPPPPTLRIGFFTPAGVRPPTTVPHRLNQVAQAAEQFLVKWMKRWGYPPAREQIFRRGRDGLVEILYVQGSERASFPGYVTPNFTTFASEIVNKATQKYQIAGDHHAWWIFTYLGDPPNRISEYQGTGTTQSGGWAIVNYLSSPGEIEPGRSLATGFNATFTLKGCIHELGHAFGLPHIGPVPSLGLGNSLMGPNNEEYARRALPHPNDVYLTEAAAAMLWKHPVFSGEATQLALIPDVALTNYNAQFDPKSGHVTISGKVTTDLPAHTAIVLDDLGNPRDQYGFRSAVGRVAQDGNFRVTLTEPGRSPGTYRILFAFENGAVSGGTGANLDYYGAILKSHPEWR